MTEEEIINEIKLSAGMTSKEQGKNLSVYVQSLLEKQWPDLTDKEKEYYLKAWESMTGTVEHAAKQAGTKEELKTAVKVIKAIRENANQNSFDNTAAAELLEILERAAQ